jgi:hypothetical protein
MAFSPTQMAQIRQYLGYSGLWPNVDTVLEQAMEAVGQDADAVTIILGYLTVCQAQETLLQNITTFGFVTDGSASAKIDPVAGEQMVRRVGRTYCGNLAAALGVKVRKHYFDATDSNDAPTLGFSSFVGYQGGGDMMRMG